MSRTIGERAFGLVEVLLALVIVAVLLALALPAVRHSMDASRGVKNLSNHRIIAGALIAYATEHNGRPPWGNDLANAPYHTPWPKALAIGGYVSDGMVFFSPKFWPRYGGGADKAGAYAVIRNPAEYPNSVRPWGYPSYGINRYGAMPASTDQRKPIRLTKVGEEGNLHRLILTRDVYQPAYDTPENRSGGGTWWFSNEDNLPEEKDTYNGIIHASFADGHAEGFPRNKMVEMMKSGSAAPLFYNVYTPN